MWLDYLAPSTKANKVPVSLKVSISKDKVLSLRGSKGNLLVQRSSDTIASHPRRTAMM